MPSFIYNILSEGGQPLKPYQFQSEAQLQETLANLPSLITTIPELEVTNSETYCVCREFHTIRGNIDILLITSNADIVIVETKLLRNPEATRTVVAQTIDYIKSLHNISVDNFYHSIEKAIPNKDQVEIMRQDIRFESLLIRNIKSGNFKALILGDSINPNLIGMIDSIQSAPHLSFTLFIAELNARILNNEQIIISPRIVSSTLEVERSVIKIDISSPENITYSVSSETPVESRKGTKPVISWEEYLQNLSKQEFRETIIHFADNWKAEISDSINMGQVGFSAGVIYQNKRIPIQFIYDMKIAIISEKIVQAYNIPEDLYSEYRDNMKQIPLVYDKYLISNKVEIPFDELSVNQLELLLNLSFTLAKKMKASEQEGVRD